ncbi:MAG: hypothetical protein ACI4MU_07435, partial [Candidatus Ventricola sp.]
EVAVLLVEHLCHFRFPPVCVCCFLSAYRTGMVMYQKPGKPGSLNKSLAKRTRLNRRPLRGLL